MDGKTIFCVNCGQVAGSATKCPTHDWGYHTFRTKAAGLWMCVNCGQLIGTGSRCPTSTWAKHKFRKKALDTLSSSMNERLNEELFPTKSQPMDEHTPSLNGGTLHEGATFRERFLKEAAKLPENISDAGFCEWFKEFDQDYQNSR